MIFRVLCRSLMQLRPCSGRCNGFAAEFNDPLVKECLLVRHCRSEGQSYSYSGLRKNHPRLNRKGFPVPLDAKD